jgi:hypothetical protein
VPQVPELGLGEWAGARWVDCYGGPWDGTMTQMEFPVEFLGHITVWPRGTTPASMSDGTMHPLGTYEPVTWAAEDLKIVRVEWRPTA